MYNMSTAKELAKIRKVLKLRKTELSKITGVSARTIYEIEKSLVKPTKRTLAKIRAGIKSVYGLDVSDKIGKFVWDLEDLDKKTLSTIEGSLLGDGCVGEDGGYTQVAKDKRYLVWLSGLLSKGGIECKVIPIKSKGSFSSSKDFWWLYSHTCPVFLVIRKQWYRKMGDKLIKRVPPKLKITPTTLLHWYLGDGGLKRDLRSEKMGKPYVRLSSDGFVREDIRLLIRKLGSTGLEFVSVPKLDESKEAGYSLYLDSDSIFRFFKFIGITPVREIKDCITEIRKEKICRFKDKWPDEEDWIRILSKDDKIGFVLRERRQMLGIGQRKLAKIVGTVPHHIVAIEGRKKHPSSSLFKKLLSALQLDIQDVLGVLAPLR